MLMFITTIIIMTTRESKMQNQKETQKEQAKCPSCKHDATCKLNKNRQHIKQPLDELSCMGFACAKVKTLNLNDFERDEVFISFGLGIEFFVNEACNRTPDHLKLEMCKNVAGADTYPILLMAIDAATETQAARDITQLESFAQIEKELGL